MVEFKHIKDKYGLNNIGAFLFSLRVVKEKNNKLQINLYNPIAYVWIIVAIILAFICALFTGSTFFEHLKYNLFIF